MKFIVSDGGCKSICVIVLLEFSNCFGLTSCHMGKYGWRELVLRDKLLVLLFVYACTTNINFGLLFLCSNIFSPLVHFCVYEVKLDNIHTLMNQGNVNCVAHILLKAWEEWGLRTPLLAPVHCAVPDLGAGCFIHETSVTCGHMP